MAEFCLECWNELNGTKDSPKKFIFTKYDDLCEGCGKYKPVILIEKKYYYQRKFRFVFLFFQIVWHLLTLPYRLYKTRKR